MKNKSEIPLNSVENINSNVSSSENADNLNIEYNNDDFSSESQLNYAKSSIKAIIKNSGEITGYQLSNGDKITKERGVELAKVGAISGVSVSTSRKGEEYLRSLRDDDESNNLNSLPIVEE